MDDVLLEDVLLKSSQGCTSGRYLRDNVDAVAVFLDHAGDAAHLPLDSIETFETC